MRRNTIFYEWNTIQLQSLNSKVCGQFCLMFLDYMKRGYSLERFCKLFTTDYRRNDKIVENFYNRLRGFSTKFKNENKYKHHVGNGHKRRSKLCIQTCKPKIL